MSRKSWVDSRSQPHNPKIHLEIAGRNYGFAVHGFPEESYEWVVEVLERQMQEIHDHAVSDTRENFRKAARELLGL